MSSAETYALRPWSMRIKIRALQRLYGFLTDKGHVFVNPVKHLKEPKTDRKRQPRNVLSEREVMRVMEQPDLSDPLGLRDRAAMEVLYGCGLRASALLSITINDLNLDAMTVSVGKDKGGKSRVSPLTVPACEFLKAYVLRVRPLLSVLKPIRSTKLWLHSKGGAMSLATLGNIVRAYGKAAGIGKRVYPHAFRHAFATSLMRRGVDVRYIQALLGHAQTSTTQIYTHVAAVDTKRAVKESHPRYESAEDLTPALEGFRYRG